MNATNKVHSSKRGTIGYAIKQLVKKYGQDSNGLYILNQAVAEAHGADRIYFVVGDDTRVLAHETPRAKIIKNEEAAILHAFQATGAVKPSDHADGRAGDGLAARVTTGQMEVAA